MTKATHNLGFKVFAMFLVIITALTAPLSIAAVVLGGECGFYSNRPQSYYESPLCEAVAYRYAREIMDNYRYGLQLTDPVSVGQGEKSNYGYELYEENVGLIAQISVPETVGYTNAYQFYCYNVWSEGEEWVNLETPRAMTLQMYVSDTLVATDGFSFTEQIFGGIYSARIGLIILAFASVITFFAALIFLICAAGHKGKTDEIHPNLQDRIPLEIYALLVIFLGGVPMAFVAAAIPVTHYFELAMGLAIWVYLAALLLACVMTTATRLKMGKWWRNSITYWAFHICWKFTKGVFTTCSDAVFALPLTWKAIALWFLISCFYFANSYNSGSVFIMNCIMMVLLLSITAQMQKLKKAGEQLAAGNLEYKVDTSRMFRVFRRHGYNLNSLSHGALIAMEQKMKSERLKTELITNVSHDIKTPLTSIINYVDLLKKEELSGQALEYLEVLDRQSRRLKKLTEDLVEASKASTGNIAAHMVSTDLCELVNQAVAEYEEKLEKSLLEVVITAEETIYGMVDGNLTWRVLSNLLSNACKYSQTGTRVYIDIAKKNDTAVISMKNISRDKLNIAAEELMERFVRGDSSRSTEGSGLGLNIARSLVELQKGTFSLAIDGDMFKAQVQYALAEPPQPPALELEEKEATETMPTEQNTEK